MDSSEGGWTVIQHRKRDNPRVNFNTTWDDYKRGFGDVNGNYWLGNDAIHTLTTAYNNSLFIRFKSTTNQSFEAQYSSFSLSDETGDYRLSLGNMSGNIVDAFRSWHPVVNHSFSTFDHDNTHSRCPASRKSGWWFNDCTLVNLNAPFFEFHSDQVWDEIISSGKYLFSSEMLIRRM
ncbi:angiopoietin-related protein 7-like [Saccostrea cucullata]|uniref:angiopoietin-related protein 7-like n=1 Tax=Saccostrea cuccullata TaxID=36930 RepID=UPI002ED15F8A